jgi:anti-anti-sigma factor
MSTVSVHMCPDGGRSTSSDTVRLSLAGEFDMSNCELIITAVTDALRAGPAVIVIDVTDVTFIDAATVRVLIGCRQACGRARTMLRLSNPNDHIARILDATGTRRILCGPASESPAAAG